MAPSLVNWKRLIDNGISSDGPAENGTELVVARVVPVPEDLIKQPLQQPQGGSGLGSDLLPVYCGVLGCLIVGLVVWIVFKQLRRRPADQEDKLQQAALQPLQLPADAEPGQPRRQEQQMPFHLPLMMRQKRRSADSGFYGSEAAAAGVAAATAEVQVGADIRCRLLRDMSESRLQRLENILANDPNPDGWRRLARELGLRAEDLAKLECHQSARGNQSAIRLMLKTWAARDSSSIGQLIRCLQRAGRSDALILFRESGLQSGLKRTHRKTRKQQQQQRQPPLPTAKTAAAAAEVSNDTADVANIAEANELPPAV